MDLSAGYCATRRSIEQRGWALTTRLSSLTERLLNAIGKDHRVFLALRQECCTTRDSLVESHQNLQNHRREHGC